MANIELNTVAQEGHKEKKTDSIDNAELKPGAGDHPMQTGGSTGRCVHSSICESCQNGTGGDAVC